MKKKVKDLILGDCFKSFLNPGLNVIIAESFPLDMDTSKWSWSRPGSYLQQDRERVVELVPSYRTSESGLRAVTFNTCTFGPVEPAPYPQTGTTIPGQIFDQLAPMPPKEIASARLPAIVLFDGLTSAECLSRYQVGMCEERVRSRLTDGAKFVIASEKKVNGFDVSQNNGLNVRQFLAAQTEFTRVVREKAEEAKKIKMENETVRVQRDVDYFGE